MIEEIKLLNIFNKISKFKIKQFIQFRNELYFLRNIYWNMVNNLTDLNLINYYKDFNSHYLKIVNQMELLKELLDHFPDKFMLADINKFKYYNIIKLRKHIIKVSNYISANDIGLILEIYDKKWVNNFTDEEYIQLLLYKNFIKPICIWDCNNHIKDNTPNTTQIIKNVLFHNILKSDDIPSENIDINNTFTIFECSNLLNDNKIIIQKNKKSISLLENKYGCSLFIKLNNIYIVIQGIFKDDLFNMAIKNPFAKNIIDLHLDYIRINSFNIPSRFYTSYFEITNLRDKIICSSKLLCEEIKKKYNDFQTIQGKSLMLLINEFILGSKYRKIDILTLFLISTEEDQKLAFILFDVFKSKDKKNIAIEIYNSLHYSIRQKLDLTKITVENEEKELTNLSETDIPYERRINLLKVGSDVKTKATEKLKSIKTNFQGDSKAQNWLDGLLKIPFNIYSENDIFSFKSKFIKKLALKTVSETDIENSITKLQNDHFINEWAQFKLQKKEYLYNIKNVLNSVVFGHKDAKLQLERIFAQWINGEQKGAVLGLHGPPGTGKTSLVKNGLSQCLKDKEGNSRPFAFLPIGGSVNGSTLVGHNYTYVGSTWGRIVDILMTTKCMNPIIFIDELDKVSNTEHGRELISILTHLTDSTQNDEFEDKFFSGIKFDLSKALIIFSFNDISLIDNVLKDRITVIETHPLKLSEKITIIKDYMLPEITKEIGFGNDEIIIEDNVVKYLIETYTLEPGVRKIKEKIVEIIREINLNRFYSDDIVFPFTISKKYCDELFELKPRVKVKKIIKEPAVGIVNGLYANASSIGGITFIQAIKFPSSKMLDLNLTGSLGDSMKESVQYALKLAFTLLPTKIQKKITEKPFGIHIHCPEGAVKKDGPSAGAAITLTIYSLLTDTKINNEIALTGEIDIIGNITAIGGLEAKLYGAKIAGVKVALFPEENLEDIEIIRKNGNSPEDTNFKVIAVNNIQQVLELCLMSKKKINK